MRFLPENIVSWTPPALIVGAGLLIAYVLSLFLPSGDWKIDASLHYWWACEALALLVTPYFYFFAANEDETAESTDEGGVRSRVLLIFVVILYSALAAGLAWELGISYFIVPEFILFCAMKYHAFKKSAPARSPSLFDAAFAPWLRAGAAAFLGVCLLFPLQALFAVSALLWGAAGGRIEPADGLGSLALGGAYFLALGVLEKGWLSKFSPANQKRT